MTDNKPDKQVSTGIKNPNGKGGFQDHPELINKEGRPKRKTLTELIHAKLDATEGGWEAIVKTAIQKALTDKEVLKTLWQYTDGMPKQSLDIDGKIQNYMGVKYVANKPDASTDDGSKGQS
mgnify:CR=1 FL=1